MRFIWMMCFVSVTAVWQIEAAQPDIDRAAAIESLAWDRFGGRGTVPNRWDDLVALFDEIKLLRETADAEVSELIASAESDPWERDEIYLSFDMAGSMGFYRAEYADPEDFTAAPEALENRLKLLRDAEQVYLELLDGLEEKGVIARLHELRESGAAFVRPIPEGMSLDELGVFTDTMSDFRRLAQMLDRRMHFSAERDDWERYVNDLESVLWLGDVAGRQSALINNLVGIAIHSLAFGQVLEDLVERRLDVVAFDRVASAIANVEPIEFADALATERLLLEATNEEYHDEHGRPKPEAVEGALFVENFLKPEGERLTIDDLDLDEFPSESEIAAWIDEVWPSLEEHARGPARVRWHSDAVYEVNDPSLAVTASLPRTIVSAYPRADRSHLQVALFREGVLTMLAIERYVRDQGEPPTLLADLVPNYLTAVPLDPLHDDRPWQYRRDDSDLGYVLYSVGRDGVDNGGTVPERWIENAFNPDYPGTDYVITHIAD